jgi:hypothetical protein
MPKKENKQTRRARLAAAKEARGNMFSPDVQVKMVGITNAPSAQNALYERAKLRAPNTFTGTPFAGRLSPEQMRQIYRAGLPTNEKLVKTAEDKLEAQEKLNENAANTTRTKRASRSNGWKSNGWGNRWGKPGNRYSRVRTNSNKSNEMRSRLTIIDATRNLKEAIKLEAEAVGLRDLLGDDEGAAAKLLKAKELRKEAGYIVAEPTPKSLKNATIAREFAEGIHAKQTRGLFGSCFGGECSVAAEPQFSSNVVRTMPTAITAQQPGNWGTRRRSI